MYRVIQFWRALTARVDPGEIESVAPLLGPHGVELFRRLSRRDQRHSLDVYIALREQGREHSALLVAGLLHDVGKTIAAIPLFYRVAVTLLQAFSPRTLAYLATRGESPLLSPFRAAQDHSEIGAQLLMSAGFPALVVELVRHHHDRLDVLQGSDGELVELAAALQSADGVN